MSERHTTALSRRGSVADFQRVVELIYHRSNDAWFDLPDLASNVVRFTVRSTKAVRRLVRLPPRTEEHQLAREEIIGRIEVNLGISISWLASMANRLDMDLETAVLDRFPGRCAKCHSCPCSCAAGLPPTDRSSHSAVIPTDITEMQMMFRAIYPPSERTLEDAALHLVEEVGEVAESILMYKTRHRERDFEQVRIESADYVSCAMGLLTSLDYEFSPQGRGNMSAILVDLFAFNCHRCNHVPCQCSFDSVLDFNLGDQW